MLNNIFKKTCAITAVVAGNMVAFGMINDRELTVDCFGTMTSCLAIGVTLLDQFVNQNITNNKCLQYGLIIPESFLVMGAFTGCLGKAEVYLDDLKNLDPSVVVLTVSVMIQAGLFKGIIDHSTPELDLAKIDSIDNIDPNSIFVDQTAEVSSELSTTTDSIQIDEGNIALEIDIVEIN